jgi:hypothetical protein
MKRSSFLGTAATSLLILIAPIISHAAPPAFKDATFNHSLQIDNPYLPLVPGTTLIYEGTTEGVPTRDEFEITRHVKTILGIKTRVIHDLAFEDGTLVEDTFDWIAQDDAGNVWYFGEFASAFEDGEVSHEGSWEAGVHGAKPGILMLAHPHVGDHYRQEFAEDVAEDRAKVLSLDEETCVPFGCFSDVLQTKETTPLEPGVVEQKFYAKGVGEISSTLVQGGDEESHLVDVVSNP